jgi:hypothetical protein
LHELSISGNAKWIFLNDWMRDVQEPIYGDDWEAYLEGKEPEHSVPTTPEKHSKHKRGRSGSPSRRADIEAARKARRPQMFAAKKTGAVGRPRKYTESPEDDKENRQNRSSTRNSDMRSRRSSDERRDKNRREKDDAKQTRRRRKRRDDDDDGGDSESEESSSISSRSGRERSFRTGSDSRSRAETPRERTKTKERAKSSGTKGRNGDLAEDDEDMETRRKTLDILESMLFYGNRINSLKPTHATTGFDATLSSAAAALDHHPQKQQQQVPSFGFGYGKPMGMKIPEQVLNIGKEWDEWTQRSQIEAQCMLRAS